MRVFDFEIRGASLEPDADRSERSSDSPSRQAGLTLLVVASIVFLVTELRPDLALPPVPSFPPQVTGSASPPATLLFTNRGAADLRIGSVWIAGQQKEEFALIYDEKEGTCAGRTLGPNQSCVVDLLFQPSAEGPRTAQLLLDDNAPGNPHRLTITGFGLPRPPDPKPELVVSPNGFDFGAREVASRAEVPVLMVNEGDAPLRLGDAQFNETEPAWSFDPQECKGTELGPNASCRALVVFSPTRQGPSVAQLSILYDSGEMTLEFRGDGLPRHGYCCTGGKAQKLDENSCTAQAGTFFVDVEELKAKCKRRDQTPPDTPATLKPGAENGFPSAWPCNPVVLTWNPVNDESLPVTYRLSLQVFNPRLAARGADPWTLLREDSDLHQNFLDVTAFVNPAAGGARTMAGRKMALRSRVPVNQPTHFRWQVSARDAAGNESAPSAWQQFTCAAPQIP